MLQEGMSRDPKGCDAAAARAVGSWDVWEKHIILCPGSIF